MNDLRYFKLCLNPQAPPHVAATIDKRFQRAGLIVLAPSPIRAREFAEAKTGMAVERGPDGKIPSSGWYDGSATTCMEVAGPIPAPTYQVAGIDIASNLLDEYQHQPGQHGERIVWWPCSPDDQCPA